MTSSKEVFKECKNVINDVIGLYLDAHKAFSNFAELIDSVQDFIIKNSEFNISELDKKAFFFSHDPEGYYKIHNDTQKGLKERLSVNGKNTIAMGNMYITIVYQYWDHYRKEIAKSLNISENEIVSPIMGDIRLIRNSIVHHRAIALPEIVRCVIVTKFNEGDHIVLERKEIIEINSHIENYWEKLEFEIENLNKTF